MALPDLLDDTPDGDGIGDIGGDELRSGEIMGGPMPAADHDMGMPALHQVAGELISQLTAAAGDQ